MNVDLHQKTDRYRRPAELYNWGECSYLVADRQVWQQWMMERRRSLAVLKPLMTLRLFARSEGQHPDLRDISVSLVVNDPEVGCLVYHVTAEQRVVNHTAHGKTNVISSRDLFLCDRAHCADGDPVPIYGSEVPWSGLPSHESLLEAVK